MKISLLFYLPFITGSFFVNAEGNELVHGLSKSSLLQLKNDMVKVEGGEFAMGQTDLNAPNREKPSHQVKLASFYIGKTEVTQGLFEDVMGWNYSYFSCDRCPVNNITWKQALSFISKLNQITGELYRLPSEAEWEFAARGGNKSKGYSYSGSNNINNVAWFAGNSKRKSHSVALKQPNELGLYDMTGNLWEFVIDDMDRNFYRRSPVNNPVNITAPNTKATAMKVIRGSGYEFSAKESDVYKRDGATSNVRLPDIGFRLAKSAE